MAGGAGGEITSPSTSAELSVARSESQSTVSLLSTPAHVVINGAVAEQESAGSFSADASPALIVVSGGQSQAEAVAEQDLTSAKYGAARKARYPNIRFVGAKKKDDDDPEGSSAVAAQQPPDEGRDSPGVRSGPSKRARGIGGQIKEDSGPQEEASIVEAASPEPIKPRPHRHRSAQAAKDRSAGTPEQAAAQEKDSARIAKAVQESLPEQARGIDVQSLRRAIADEISAQMAEQIARARADIESAMEDMRAMIERERSQRFALERELSRIRANRQAADMAISLLMGDEDDDLFSL